MSNEVVSWAWAATLRSRLVRLRLLRGISLGCRRRISKEDRRRFVGRRPLPWSPRSTFPRHQFSFLSRGRESIVLKGTEATTYTTNELLIPRQKLPIASSDNSELEEMMKLLPPRVLDRKGREGDVVNLIFVASAKDLTAAFERAGWLQVEKSKARIIWHLAWERNHYTKLPMAALYVFGRAQDYSFALPDPASIVARRHHLRGGFEEHLKQTNGHVERLEQIFKELGEKPTGKKCKGMEGLVEEGVEMIKEDELEDEARDAGLISAAQRVEHYEIAAYGCVRTYVNLLGEGDAAALLDQTLKEEKETDQKLTKLAEKINVEAEKQERGDSKSKGERPEPDLPSSLT